MTKKILIVEDETTLLDVLARKFTKEKFEVLQARDGLDGLNIALSEHPDIILLDIVMPRMDGMTMLEKIRQDAWGKNAQVILLTNLADTDQVASATNLRVFDYLVKSNWKIEDVVKKVKEKLQIA